MGEVKNYRELARRKKSKKRNKRTSKSGRISHLCFPNGEKKGKTSEFPL